MAGLSPSEVEEILAVLFRLNEQGITIVLIEHIMRAVMSFSTRLVVLVAGHKIADGAAAGGDPQPRGREGLSWRVASRSPGSTPATAWCGCSRTSRCRSRTAETVALLGTNGNGKSTLMKCIMGMLRPTAGTHRRRDRRRDSTIWSAARTEEIVDLGISLVPEGRRLFPKLTVEENLLLGAFRRTARSAIAAQPRIRPTRPSRCCSERRRQLAGSMSGGEQQMLALARALMSAPRILLIDEPSVGLAPILVSRTIDKIKELKERFQLTVLMAEQNFNQAVRIADRGYVIVHGQIAFEGRNTDELNNNELVRKFYLGL